MVLTAVMTAFVVILQLLGQFIRFGTFSVSLVLIPIVIGSALCGVAAGAWLGFVFGIVVLCTPDAALFMSISIFGTIVTVLLKGIACGIAAALAYKLFEKVNRYVAVIAAAIACPLANTGVFLLGSSVFFMDYVRELGTSAGYNNMFLFMLVGFVGLNFVFELIFNLILSPVVVRVLDIVIGKKTSK